VPTNPQILGETTVVRNYAADAVAAACPDRSAIEEPPPSDPAILIRAPGVPLPAGKRGESGVMAVTEGTTKNRR
jgi:hypothetical protein